MRVKLRGRTRGSPCCKLQSECLSRFDYIASTARHANFVRRPLCNLAENFFATIRDLRRNAVASPTHESREH